MTETTYCKECEEEITLGLDEDNGLCEECSFKKEWGS